MKRYINRYLFKMMVLAITLTGFGCEDETTDGLSKITVFPIVTLNGDQWNRIPVGGTWTDPGVTSKEGETEIETVVGGDVVDPSTPGVYVITYTATNQDGFQATERRYVGVIAPDVEGIDISGSYKRNAGAFGVSTVTKVADNLYKTDNVGGVATPGPSTTVYFYHITGNELAVPSQDVMGSEFSAINATVTVGANYSWAVINPGYGAALRTFEKI